MKTIQDIENQLIEEFGAFDEWLDRYEYIIELGKSLEEYPQELKTDDRLIKGCQSRVWLDSTVSEGKVFFRADSDAIITKGIISLLIRVYSGQKASDIANADFGFVDAIGLRQNLSPTRAGGLASMIEKIKSVASGAM